MAAPFVLLGASVITMDPARPAAEAVAIEGNRITAVGTQEDVRGAAGERAEVVELGGGALLPGFIDAHHHYSMSSFERPLPDVHHEPGISVEELLARIAEPVPRASGAWFRAHGYDPLMLRERRAPRREELDELCPDRPLLLISGSFLEGCVNSRALEEMGWSDHSADPPNGRLVRDRRGRLTGEIGEAALCLVEARSRGALLAEEAWLEDCERHGRELLAAGITRVGDAAVPPAFERLYERAVADGRLPITVHRMPVSAGSMMEPRLDARRGQVQSRACTEGGQVQSRALGGRTRRPASSFREWPVPSVLKSPAASITSPHEEMPAECFSATTSIARSSSPASRGRSVITAGSSSRTA